MKTKCSFLISMLTFGLFMANFLQAQVTHTLSEDGKTVIFIPAATSEPFTLDFAYEKQKKYIHADVPATNAVIVFSHQGIEIGEIEVVTDAYDARVTKSRIDKTGNTLAKFSVAGHPKGTFTVTFTDLDANPDPSEGRQKNRRVEMEVVFE